ncbi:MAG: hypothetical protein Q8876_02955 [Bacillota bacterium]|nr:hypothetical protein [Bacillota bacterium]
MKVLIISSEVWRDDMNGGNVLSNIFSGLDLEIAQIFCSPGIPQNNICSRYYQMTDSMIINNIIKGIPIGNSFLASDIESDLSESKPQQPNKGFYSFFHKNRLRTFYVIKEFLWKISNWKNKNLDDFIKDFDPDIIFAPSYSSTIMLKINQYVKKLTKKPMITYLWDDNYSFKRFNFSPIFWIDHLIMCHNFKKTIPIYDHIYSMTEEQAQEYGKIFNKEIKVLQKSGDFSENKIKTHVNCPIRMVYAGSLYLNRWKTLERIVSAMDKINADSVKITLDIYTRTELKKSQEKKLLRKGYVTIHPPVTMYKLRGIYQNSDIAIHVESFKIRNRWIVRLSFSAKIMDCLESGCATLAVCPPEQPGFRLIQKNNIGICVNKIEDIDNELQNICNNPEIILEYSKRTYNYGRKYHQREKIQKDVLEDFLRLAGTDK